MSEDAGPDIGTLPRSQLRAGALAHDMAYGSHMEMLRLRESDRAAAEAFLVQHRDSSMFLRANIRRCGFEYDGQPFQGVYVGAFDSGRIAGMIGHSWSGMLMVQTPAYAEALARLAVKTSGREVTGFSGPRDHVERVRSALGMARVSARLDEEEDLYGLELSALRLPRADGGIACRLAVAADRDTLVRFRREYDVEALGGDDGERSRERSATFMDAQLSAGHAWVAVADGDIVSLSAFNAALPDIVQLGGIYTPPAHRGKSYAKHAVAAQLVDARAAGVSRCVLFAKNPSAVRCYRALGFERLGEFALVLLQ